MSAAAAPSAHVCTPARRPGFHVWHLVGPQGCGKGLFAQAATEVIMARKAAAVTLSAWELEQEFAGNPARIAQYMRSPLVLLLETHMWEVGEHPRHWMRGDRLIDCTDYLTSRARRPGLDRLLVMAMLDKPTRGVDQLRSEVKEQYAGLARSMVNLSDLATQRPRGAA